MNDATGPRASDTSPFVDGGALVDLSATTGAFAAGGPDALDYLQRQLSNDLRQLTPERGQPCTLMTRKGKLIAAFDLYRVGERFIFCCERSAIETLVEGLERLVILEEVEFTREDSVGRLLSLQGPRAAEILRGAFGGSSEVADEYGVLPGGTPGAPILCARRRRCGAGGFDLLVAHADWIRVCSTLESCGALRVSGDAAEAARIDAGVPRFGVDATTNHMPPECGYESAVSYSKGCYVGQEIVARLRTYGHVNQLLLALELGDDSVPPAGTRILAAGEPCGVVTSASCSPSTGRGVALAFLRYGSAVLGERVEVELPGRRVLATLRALYT